MSDEAMLDYVIETRQKADLLFGPPPALLGPSEIFASPVRLVLGYGAINFLVVSDIGFALRIEEAPTPDGPWVQTQAQVSAADAQTGRQFVCLEVVPCGAYMRIFVNNDITQQGIFDLAGTGLPVAGGTGGGGGGGGGGGDIIDVSGTTTDTFVEAFSVSQADGMMGIGTILNTGANALIVQETVTDKFGNTAVVQTLVPAGGDYMLDLQTNFTGVGQAFPPYIAYTVEVESAVAGLPTTYQIEFITVGPSTGGGGGGGGSESLDQARSVGDTFFGGDVFWNDARGAIFGKASGEANQDYLKIFSDKTNGVQVIESTKDGAGTYRDIIFRTGGADTAKLSTAGAWVVGDPSTSPPSDGYVYVRKDTNGGAYYYGENRTNGVNSSAGITLLAADGLGTFDGISIGSCSAAFTSVPSLAGKAFITGAGNQAYPLYINMRGVQDIRFGTSDTERARYLSTGEYIYGATTLTATEKFKIVGDTLIDGKLTVTGAIDPTSLSLSGGTALYFESADGSTAPLSAAGHARIRYVNPTGWQQSINGGAYAAFSGGGPGSDTTAWHNAGDAFAAQKIIGTTDAFDFIAEANGIPLMALGSDKNIYFGNVLTHEATNGVLKYRRSDYWATLYLKCDQDGSGGIGTGESQMALLNDIDHNVVLNSIGSNYPGTTYGVPNADQGRLRSDNANLVIGTVGVGSTLRLICGNLVAIIVTDAPHVTTTCPTYIGTLTGIANEILRASGILHVDGLAGFGSLTGDPVVSLQVRRDAADSSTSLVLDNQNAAGNPLIRVGNDPLNTSSSIFLGYDNATNNSRIAHNGAGTLTVGSASNTATLIITNSTTRVTVAAGGDVTVANGLLVSGQITASSDITYPNSGTLSGTNRTFSLGGTALAAIYVRKDAAGTTGGASLMLDNRTGTGNPVIYLGNDPNGSNNALAISYDNATNATRVVSGGAGDMTVGCGANQSLLFLVNNVAQMTLSNDGGLQMGAPTGGSKGAGTINVASDIYKNNTAYTNPKWVLQRYYTGKNDVEGEYAAPKEYSGLMNLGTHEEVVRAKHDLPLMLLSPKGGYFERGDLLLASVEEAYLYIYQLHKRIRALEERVAG